MSTTKHTTIWCDYQDATRGRCSQWIMLNGGDANGARIEARADGWSRRLGIGDCCPEHGPRATPSGTDRFGAHHDD